VLGIVYHILRRWAGMRMASNHVTGGVLRQLQLSALRRTAQRYYIVASSSHPSSFSTPQLHRSHPSRSRQPIPKSPTINFLRSFFRSPSTPDQVMAAKAKAQEIIDNNAVGTSITTRSPPPAAALGRGPHTADVTSTMML
jgi:hypothetical protein